MSDSIFNKIKIVKIQADFETCERAGAGGMFQVISITYVYSDDKEECHTDLIDQGDMFHSPDEVLEVLGISKETVETEYC